jgi:hypothetical protein
MDARAQLRRFLEQRREAGETELVFDQLSVDEAMRLLGALPREETGDRSQATGQEPDVRSQTSAASPAGDWRNVLKQADAAPVE